MSGDVLERIGRIVGQGGDADDVLRAVVRALADEAGTVWAGISFLEDGTLELGPQAGVPDETRRVGVPVTYRNVRVGELAVDGKATPALLEQVATLVSAHVLLGWDTGGEAWEP